MTEEIENEGSDLAPGSAIPADVQEETNKAATETTGTPPSTRWIGHDEIQPWAGTLDLGIDAFEKKIDVANDQPDSIPDPKVYGLLALERNGQNRTPYVKAMMKRLGLSKDELPGGGPSWTNDISSISDL